MYSRFQVIYTSRNPKDMVVSYYHYCTLVHGLKGTFEEFCDLFMRDRAPFGPVWNHIFGTFALCKIQKYSFMGFNLKFCKFKKVFEGKNILLVSYFSSFTYYKNLFGILHAFLRKFLFLLFLQLFFTKYNTIYHNITRKCMLQKQSLYSKKITRCIFVKLRHNTNILRS